MEDRYGEAASAYRSLVKFYPESKYREEADEIMATITEELAKFTK